MADIIKKAVEAALAVFVVSAFLVVSVAKELGLQTVAVAGKYVFMGVGALVVVVGVGYSLLKGESPRL